MKIYQHISLFVIQCWNLIQSTKIILKPKRKKKKNSSMADWAAKTFIRISKYLYPILVNGQRRSFTQATRLLLASPIETVARDLEAHALAFIAPSCKLLLLQGSFRELHNCIARFRYARECSNMLPNLRFRMSLLQVN